MPITIKQLLPYLGCIIFSMVYACQSTTPAETTQLTPSDFLLAESDLPDYEKNIDHARLIGGETEEFHHKGQIVYRNVCFNCHGNKDQEGSMPNSLKFWADSLKHGADPYSIYQTLTRGYGMMAPQSQLTPQEKYLSLIHI